MKYTDKQEFEKVNLFGTGVPNEMFAKYFIPIKGSIPRRSAA